MVLYIYLLLIGPSEELGGEFQQVSDSAGVSMTAWISLDADGRVWPINLRDKILAVYLALSNQGVVKRPPFLVVWDSFVTDIEMLYLYRKLDWILPAPIEGKVDQQSPADIRQVPSFMF